MAKLAIQPGSVQVTVYLFIQDSSSTTGAGLTGLAFNTTDLVCYYVRDRGAATALSLVTLSAVDSAWASGGFKEVSSANMPGVYRLDLANAILAAGSRAAVVMLKGAANMAPVLLEIDLQSQVTIQSGRATGQLDTFSGQVLATVHNSWNNGQTQNTIPGIHEVDVVYVDGAAEDIALETTLGSPAGASISADIAAVKSDTGNILTDTGTTLPGILGTPSGVDLAADIAAVKADTAAILDDTGTSGVIVASIATDAVSADALAADAVAEIQSGLSTFSAATDAVLISSGRGTGQLDIMSGQVLANWNHTWENGNQNRLIDGVREVDVLSMGGDLDTLPATPAQVTSLTATEIADALRTDAGTELAAVPAAAAPIASQLQFVYQKIRNKETSTNTAATIANDAGATIGTSTLSDDGTTFTKGEYA